jgi:hypothetical protein
MGRLLFVLMLNKFIRIFLISGNWSEIGLKSIDNSYNLCDNTKCQGERFLREQDRRKEMKNVKNTNKLPDMSTWTDEQIAAYFDAEVVEENGDYLEITDLGNGTTKARNTRTGEEHIAHSGKWLLDI